MARLITTLGPKASNELGMILPHEHVYVDLKKWNEPGYADAEASNVVETMAPQISLAQSAGITAIVECSCVGVGRRADILKAVSEATLFPLVAPTGVYREPWVPLWVHEASEESIREWMMSELLGEIEKSGVQAGWIKLSASDEGMTPTERKILRAAARAGAAANAVIGSHTLRGSVVRDQLKVIEDAGYTPERFIWIHAHVEPDINVNFEMARRGVWIEYDGIGEEERDGEFIHRILRMMDAGLAGQVMLSQDRGWYLPKPYTYIKESFLPKLRAEGIDEEAISLMTCENPYRAFAR